MSLTTPYSDSFQEADGVTTKFFFNKKFEPISKNYVKCEVYNADGSVIVPDFEPVLEEGAIKIVALTQPDGTVLNAPRAGSIVRIYRDVPEVQNTTVAALQSSTASQIVNNFDNIVAMIQELQYSDEHFTVRSTMPQRDITIQLLTEKDDKKLIYWDNENRKLVVTSYGQDEIVLSQSVRQLKEENGNFYYYAGGEWHLLVASETLEHNVAELNEKIENIKQTTYTKSEIDNKVAVINAEIDGNADAIQKTRDDYIAADSEIHQILNNHASELTTLRGNQASLGDQVAGIEEKIPESASGTNPLITKQQLLDEEMDIRDDMNQTDSELQSQITVQAAAIATLDSEKIDKNQGSINAGKILTVGEDGFVVPSAGGTGGGLQAVAHDNTMSGAGTDDSPLGLSEAIKDEIADKAPKETVEALTQIINGIIGDYVKKSGDTMTGALNVPEITVQTAEGTFIVSVVAGVVTIATNNGLDIAAQTKFDTAPTTDDNTTWANALDTSLVRKAQVVTAISDALANFQGGTRVIFREWEE